MYYYLISVYYVIWYYKYYCCNIDLFNTYKWIYKRNECYYESFIDSILVFLILNVLIIINKKYKIINR